MFRFLKCETGNVAVIFALALVPLALSFGVVLDYGRQINAQTKIQSAIDAAALALSKMPTSTSLADLTTKAQQYFNANFSDSEVSVGALTVTPGTRTLSLSVSGTLPTRMMTIADVTTMPLRANATVKWGGYKLRVALALDTTGSMSSSNKLTVLKTATKNLLDQLKAAAPNDGDVEVAIIPFSEMVNVGSSNKTATWIDKTTEFGTCSLNPSTNVSKLRCYNATNKFKNGSWTPGTWANWNGCITDRGAYDTPSPTTAGSGYDQRVTAPDISIPASLFPAASPSLSSSCPATMIGLSHDWTALKSTVNSLVAQGATNQPIGLVWAWQALVGGGPLSVSTKDPNAKYKEAIILLSDGLNTRDRWNGNGSNTSTDVDSRMCSGTNCSIGTCNNIKSYFTSANSDFILYTIQVNTSGDPTSTLLRNCASSTDKFYLLTSATDMIVTFNNIGSELVKLHLSQ